MRMNFSSTGETLMSEGMQIRGSNRSLTMRSIRCVGILKGPTPLGELFRPIRCRAAGAVGPGSTGWHEIIQHRDNESTTRALQPIIFSGNILTAPSSSATIAKNMNLLSEVSNHRKNKLETMISS